jgi:2-dehydropantoate 2-reductase
MLEEAFDNEQLMLGVCRIGARISEPGHISHTDPASVIIGTNHQTESNKTDTICGLFRQAKVKCRVSNDITREIWKKFSWNAIFNMLTAAENCTVEAFYEKGEPDPRVGRLADEILKTAKAEGLHLGRNDLNKMINRSSALGGFITSTLHDRREGKTLEYDAFTGALLRLGNKHGLELPEFRKLHRRLEDLSKIGFFNQ